MAPSSVVDMDKVAQAADFVKAHYGIKVFIHSQTFLRHGSSAGTSAQKAEALRDLMEDDAVGAIWAARAGNRAVHALPFLPQSVRAKPLIGYSDTTAWLSAFGGGIHGPLFQDIPSARPCDADAVFDLLDGKSFTMEGQVLCPGRAEGRLVGGNLAVLCALIGTPYAPDFNKALLCLEDWKEESSRIDRFLAHLSNAGVLRTISGLVLGDFLMQDTGKMPYGFTLQDMVLEHTQGLSLPIAWHMPFGHGGANAPLPLGAWAVLEDGQLFS